MVGFAEQLRRAIDAFDFPARLFKDGKKIFPLTALQFGFGQERRLGTVGGWFGSRCPLQMWSRHRKVEFQGSAAREGSELAEVRPA